MRRRRSIASPLALVLALTLATIAHAGETVRTDSVVIGAGPGGIAYAIAQKLADPSRTVTVLEARPFPKRAGDQGDGGATPWGTLPRVFTVVEGLKNDDAYLGLDGVDEPLVRRTEEFLDGRRDTAELDDFKADPGETRRWTNVEQIGFNLNAYFDFKPPNEVGSDALALRKALNKFRRGTIYAGDYQRALYHRAKELGVDFVFDAPVVKVEAGEAGPVPVTRDGTRFAATHLVISAGATTDLEELVGIKSEKVSGRETHIIASVVRRKGDHEISLLRNHAPAGSRAKDLGMVMLEMEGRTGVLVEVAPEEVARLKTPAALAAHTRRILGRRGVAHPDFEVAPVMFSSALYRASEYSKKIGGPVGGVDNVFVIGDKARTTHPFTGLGAAYAVRDAIVLANHLAAIDRVSPRSIAAKNLVKSWLISMRDATEQLHQTAYHTYNNIDGPAKLDQVQTNGFFSFAPVDLHYEPVALRRSSEKYAAREAVRGELSIRRLGHAGDERPAAWEGAGRLERPRADRGARVRELRERLGQRAGEVREAERGAGS